jgi:hypothetical protein
MLKKSYSQHEKNAIELRLLLIEPAIIAHYGNLQFSYVFDEDEKKYGNQFQQSCTLYIEHVINYK